MSSTSQSPAQAPLSHFLAWALLLGAGSVWGVTFSLAKIATNGGAHPFGITLWQGILGALVLLAVCIARRQGIPLGRKHLVFYAVCGLSGTALPSTLFFFAAKHIAAGVLAIVLATVPILTFAGALPLRIEHVEWRRVLGVILGIAAVVLIMIPELELPEAGATIWILAALLAAACYGFENIYIALRMPADTGAATILTGMMIMATVWMVPVVMATDSFVPLTWPWGVVEWSVAAMAVINVVSYGLFIFLVVRAGPLFASLTAYVVTLSGVLWGIALFNEQHSAWIWSALIVMMGGLTLVKPKS